MDFFGAVETDEAIHGPRSSAERLSRKMTRKDLEAGRSWLKLRAAKLDKQQPKPFATFLAGVVVYFEGYTETYSALKLKKMVCNNGGKVSHYFSKSRTTHVVCTNLSTSKRNYIVRTRRNVIIVHPDWIVESCRQKQRLAEEPYAVVVESTPDVITHYFPKIEQPTKKRTLEDLQTKVTVESDGKENNDGLANSQPTPKEEEAKRGEEKGHAEQDHHHPKAKRRRKEKKTKNKPFRKKDLERKFGRHPNQQCAWAAQIPLGQRASY